MAAGIDLDVEHGGAAEGIHISNAAGLWQIVVFGFAGLKTALQCDLLTFEPRLPAQWSRLAFPVAWKGARVSVEISREKLAVVNRGDVPLPVCIRGETRTLDIGQTEIWMLSTPSR
jgi:kojibiose phosphorylase